MTAYLLADDVRYRRERFGGALMRTSDRRLRFYNETASRLLEHCIIPHDIESLAAAAGTSPNASIRSFVEQLLRAGILEPATDRDRSRAELYQVNVTEFPESHFLVPIGVECEMTMKCYRNCTYCAYDSNPHYDTTGELSVETWCKILDDIKAAGVFFVRFTGGDPMTKPGFLEIVKYADSLRLVTMIGTDLTIFKEEDAKELAKLKYLHAIQTTLDGATPETANELRGRGNFEQVMKGMKWLQEYNVPFIVGTVFNKRNLHEIPAIGKLVGEMGAQGYCVGPLYSAGRGHSEEDIIPSNEDLAEASRLFKELMSSGVVASADPAWPRMAEDASDQEIASFWSNQPFLLRQPDRLMRIDPWGRCYASIKLKDKIQEEAFVGNVTETPLIDIWHKAPLFNMMREMKSENSHFGNVVDVRKVVDKLKEKRTNVQP